MTTISNSPFRTSLLFTGLTFLQPAINLLLLPVYLAYLSPEDYGIYALMVSISVMAHHLAALRIQDAMGPLYFRFHNTQEHLQRFLIGLLQATVVLNAIFLALSMTVGPVLFRAIFGVSSPINFYPLGFLAILAGIFSSVSAPYLIFLKNARKASQFAALHVAMVAINIAAQLIFIVGMQRGARGALEARLAGPILLAVLTLGINFRYLFRFPDRAQLKAAFRFAIPLVPYALVMWSATFVDRLVVERSLDLTTLGAYSLLLAMVTLVTMASNAAWNGVQPFLFEELSEQERPRSERLRQLARTYFAIPFLAGGFIAACSQLLPVMTDNTAYLSVMRYTTLGISVYLFESVSIFLRGFLIHALKPGVITTSSIAAVGIQFGAYLVLIPLLGINGALLGALGAQAILLLVYVIRIRQKFATVWLSVRFIIRLPAVLIMLFVLPELLVRSGMLHPVLGGCLQFLFTTLPFLWYFMKNSRRMLWNS